MSNRAESRLNRTSPETQEVASSVILEFINALEDSPQEVHSFMLLKHGCVIAEAWWSPYAPTIPHTMFSLSKSFTSTAIGMAVSEGLLTVDDPVTSFFPDALPEHMNDHIKAMQVRHLLTMSTGHDEKPFPFMHRRADGNWAKGFFETPVIYPPGSHFLYNTGASYLLSEIIQCLTGQNLMDFLTPRLFEPLSIENATWLESPVGVSLGGVGLSLTTEDIARFGQLYLQKGMWNGKQILSEAWIEEATSAQISNGDDPNSDWAQGYGYQFWRCRHGIYRGDGAFGQFCFVMDDYDTVLAMTSAAKDMQEVMNIVWDVLLPGLQNEVSTEDSETHRLLVEKSSNLSYAPPEGQVTSPLVTQISGKTYRAEPNDLGIETFSLDFTASGCTLHINRKKGDESITAPYEKWQEGQASPFNEIWLEGSLPLIASGAWLTDDRYVILFRFYETPYVYTLTHQFDGDHVTLTIQINVSLESTEPHIIKATYEKA